MLSWQKRLYDEWEAIEGNEEDLVLFSRLLTTHFKDKDLRRACRAIIDDAKARIKHNKDVILKMEKSDAINELRKKFSRG